VSENDLETLQNPQLTDFINLLRYDLLFDLVIFDTPAVLDFSDALDLANSTGGTVILVVEAGQTKRAEILSAVERFSMLSVRIIGAVVNRSQSTWANLAPIPASTDWSDAPTNHRSAVVTEGNSIRSDANVTFSLH
jgi:Mrp family chromosome partitioning ATPase